VNATATFYPQGTGGAPIVRAVGLVRRDQVYNNVLPGFSAQREAERS